MLDKVDQVKLLSKMFILSARNTYQLSFTVLNSLVFKCLVRIRCMCAFQYMYIYIHMSFNFRVEILYSRLRQSNDCTASQSGRGLIVSVFLECCYIFVFLTLPSILECQQESGNVIWHDQESGIFSLSLPTLHTHLFRHSWNSKNERSKPHQTRRELYLENRNNVEKSGWLYHSLTAEKVNMAAITQRWWESRPQNNSNLVFLTSLALSTHSREIQKNYNCV